LSQSNITIDDTKKQNTSTVKHSSACFQHRLSQSNITTNLTNGRAGGVDTARQRASPRAGAGYGGKYKLKLRSLEFADVG
jgi:hypothetical protein